MIVLQYGRGIELGGFGLGLTGRRVQTYCISYVYLHVKGLEKKRYFEPKMKFREKRSI